MFNFISKLFKAPVSNQGLSRRGFLKAIAGTAVAAPLIKYLPAPAKQLTAAEKELIIAQALSTEEGRLALAQSMVEPIRRSLEYQAVGRKLLLPDATSSRKTSATKWATIY